MKLLAFKNVQIHFRDFLSCVLLRIDDIIHADFYDGDLVKLLNTECLLTF
jgi:hypothetical protein